MMTAKSFGLGFLLLLPALLAVILGGSVTARNAVAFVFMIAFSSLAVGFVVASHLCQAFRPLRRNGLIVAPMMIALAAVCLGIAILSYNLNATMSLGQLLALVF
jgi:hypothetical protein